MMSSSSARHFSVTISVTYRKQTRDFGVFDTWEGGNVTAENTKHRRGAMGPQIAIGGPKTIEDVTITRDYDPPRDQQHVHWLAEAVGRARVTARKADLDSDGIAYGRPLVITGVLVGYSHPSSDSDSGDFAFVGLTISPDGEIG